MANIQNNDHTRDFVANHANHLKLYIAHFAISMTFLGLTLAAMFKGMLPVAPIIAINILLIFSVMLHSIWIKRAADDNL